jgi:hypothetical protein
MIVKKIFKAHWWKFLIAILGVATIANVVITQNIFGLLLGLLLGLASAFLIIMSLMIGEEKLRAASIIMLLAMFLWTCMVDVPKGKIVILEDKNTIQVVTEKTVFVLPFTKRVVRVTNFEVATVVELPTNDGRRIQWDVNAELKLATGPEGVFNFIRQYGSKDAWWEEIKKRIQNVAQEYVKETFHEQNLPLKFEITLRPEQTKTIKELGYEVVKIEATNGRIRKQR